MTTKSARPRTDPAAFLSPEFLARLAADFPRPSASGEDVDPACPEASRRRERAERFEGPHATSPDSPSFSPSELRPQTSNLQNRCSHTTRDGRRCRSLSTSPDSIYCETHARLAWRDSGSASVCPTCHRATRGPDPLPPNLANELLGPVEDFQTSASINHALARLVILQARNRIPPRNAAVLAYTFQLLLQTLPETKSEVRSARRFPHSDPYITQAVNALPPLDTELGSAKSPSKR